MTEAEARAAQPLSSFMRSAAPEMAPSDHDLYSAAQVPTIGGMSIKALLAQRVQQWEGRRVNMRMGVEIPENPFLFSRAMYVAGPADVARGHIDVQVFRDCATVLQVSTLCRR